jgi:malate dehydrogenase (oxaloacetate-decarboxylating)(NADP+)
VFPNLDAANIALGVVKTMTEALHVGPILLGPALPAHILSPSVTSRGVVNMATLAVVEASFGMTESFDQRRCSGLLQCRLRM